MTTLQQDNKKYFIVSDIHSFAKEFKSALKIAGFCKTNKNHILIVCGDVFDRGPDSIGVYNFIISVPKSRCILIRGNHEQLYLELLNKSFPESYDFSNGTVNTFCQIAGFDTNYINKYSESFYLVTDEINRIKNNWEQIVAAVKQHPITKWLKSKEWKNYFELNNKFIFVHSFIPTKLKQECIDQFGMIAYGFENPDCYEYNPDWRNIEYWGQAIWGCPWSQYDAKLFEPEENAGRVLVCGHWHTSDFFKHLKNIKYGHDGDIYYSKGLIGIDGGVFIDPIDKTLIHDQNVLVIDKSMICYTGFGLKLEEEKTIPIIETVSERGI